MQYCASNRWLRALWSRDEDCDRYSSLFVASRVVDHVCFTSAGSGACFECHACAFVPFPLNVPAPIDVSIPLLFIHRYSTTTTTISRLTVAQWTP